MDFFLSVGDLNLGHIFSNVMKPATSKGFKKMDSFYGGLDEWTFFSDFWQLTPIMGMI